MNNKKIKEKNNKEINKDKCGKEKNSDKKNISKVEELNDEEINDLDYKTAIKIDKRTYIQYYWSLLKKKQLILFTFYSVNDYNITIIKISFFIVSFSLFMTINGFFFSDDTMHKVYEDSGKYNILYQIPQILYSSLISVTVNSLLKYLSLSEKSILELKKRKKLISKNSEEIEKCLKIKLILYLIIGMIFMLFFWYFISSFCAVYTNTQIILLENTMISFGLSMIYPFGYVLLPGIFRIPALKAKNQDQKCIYKLSKLIALI